MLQISDTLSTFAGVPVIGSRITALVVVLFVFGVLFLLLWMKRREVDA
jgi:hypothetical protein